ncbi:GNAT family N-acetyltransferase [Desulfobacterota bacterium AH_259_B03_O07]|nr:GNAT family N-acetyltransferase [Desulfobacterota bacterium AH_259_B03_O07]
MAQIKIREAAVGDAEAMAIILREIGWSERRNALPLREVWGPIEKLIEHTVVYKENHTALVAVDENDEVIGFTNVHWVPFIMLGSYEGYVSDVFVSPKASGRGAGNLLLESIMKEGKARGCMRLMVTNGKDKSSYKRGFYKKLGWTERPQVANFVFYYREPWS